MRKILVVLLFLLCGAAALWQLLPEKTEEIPTAETPAEAVPTAAAETLPTEYLASAERHAADEMGVITVWSEGELRETAVSDYLPGVLAGEMPADFEAEALRAQAVAARTFLMYKCAHGCASHPEAVACDDPSCCKAWRSEAALREKWGEDYETNWAKMCAAVSDTDGEYLAYESQPIQAVFHSSSAGCTECSGSIWQALPYLVSVESPEGEEDVPNFVTEVEVSAESFREKICSLHPAADFSGEPGAWLGAVYRNDAGRVTYANIGGAALSGTELRQLFALRSTCFTVEYADGRFLFHVTGYGHGVGMSQYGANVMAREGADYGEILAHYYPGTELISPEEGKCTAL